MSSEHPGQKPSGWSDDELRLTIQKVARRIRNNRGDESISDTQLSVLFHLDNHGPLTPGRLAELERVTPPSMNRTVNSLQERGLVGRTVDAHDARRVNVSLTPTGSALVAETRRLRTAWFTRRLAELTGSERAALDDALPVLRKLAES